MTTHSLAYRDSLEGARLRYADLLTVAREEQPVSSAVSGVLAARTGRIWAGIAGISGAAVMASTALARAFHAHEAPSPTLVLLASWPAMGVAYLAGNFAGHLRGRRVHVPRRTGDVHADLARLEEARSSAPSRGRAIALEGRSLALPMTAVGLLAPLTIHFAFYQLGSIGGGFDDWISLSLMIVGHAHLVLVGLLWALARKVRKLTISEIAVEQSRAGWRILGWTVLASAIPGIVFLLIPPVLTTVTGLLFIPVLVWAMLGSLRRERAALAL